MSHTLALSNPSTLSAVIYNPPVKGDAGAMKDRDVKKLGSDAQPTIMSVWLKLLDTVKGLTNCLLKPIYYICDWIVTFNPDMAMPKQLSELGKNTKNVAGIAGLPEKGIAIKNAAKDFIEKRDVSSLANIANRISLFTMPAVDALKVVAKTISPLSKSVATTAETAYNTASVFSAVYGTKEEMDNIAKEKEKAEKAGTAGGLVSRHVIDARDAKVTESWLKLATYANYFALGVLGLLVTFTEYTVAPWVMLALATGGFIFTVMQLFQKEMYVNPAEAKLAATPAGK